MFQINKTKNLKKTNEFPAEQKITVSHNAL